MDKNRITHTVRIEVRGAFNYGWLAYVLGLERPADEAGANGYDMAMETVSLNTTRIVMHAQHGLDPAARQYEVHTEA